jgi:hypothetical protein
VVERRDVGDDADRRAGRERVVVTLDRDRRVASRQGQRGVVAKQLGHPPELRPGLAQRTAVIERLELVELVHVGFHHVGQLVDQAATGAHRHVSPFRRRQGAPGTGHGGVHVCRLGIGHARDDVARAGRGDGHRAARQGGPLQAVDVQPVHGMEIEKVRHRDAPVGCVPQNGVHHYLSFDNLNRGLFYLSIDH